jgi:hypothetical protein
MTPENKNPKQEAANAPSESPVSTERQAIDSSKDIRTESEAELQSTHVKRDDFMKIVEDPYFQYLVEKKARAQARSFLVAVGSVIAAIILYSGWEFKSAKNEIDKNVAAIQEEAKGIQARKQEIDQAAQSAADRVNSSTQLLTDTQNYSDQSEKKATAMLASIEGQINTSVAAVQGQVASSENLQRNFFDAENQLLNTTSTIVGQAKTDADRINSGLSKLNEIDEKIQKVDEANKKVELQRQEVSNFTDTVRAQVSSVKSLEQLNEELLKTRTTEFVFLRERRHYTVRLPSICQKDLNKPTPLSYKVTFRVDSVKNKFTVYWTVDNEGQPNEVNPSEMKWDIKERPKDQKDSPYIYLKGTPYIATLEQVYGGFFSSELVVIKVTLRDDWKALCASSVPTVAAK